MRWVTFIFRVMILKQICSGVGQYSSHIVNIWLIFRATHQVKLFESEFNLKVKISTEVEQGHWSSRSVCGLGRRPILPFSSETGVMDRTVVMVFLSIIFTSDPLWQSYSHIRGRIVFSVHCSILEMKQTNMFVGLFEVDLVQSVCNCKWSF